MKKLFVMMLVWIFPLVAKLPQLEQIRPFQVEGEKLKFAVSYLGVVGGYATMVTTPLEDKRVIKFELRGNTISWVESIFKLRLYLGSFSDSQTLQTLKYLESKQENERYYYNVQYFFPDKYYYIYSHRRNKSPLKNEKIKYASGGGISVLSAFYYGRTTDLKLGKIYYSTCFFRQEERKIGIHVLRKEKIETKLGKFNTIVISPVMKFDGFLTGQKKMEVFLSDDKYKTPLLVEVVLSFGSIKATLIEGYPPIDSKKSKQN